MIGLVDKNGGALSRLKVKVKNKICVNDNLEVLTPQGESENYDVGKIYNEEDELVALAQPGDLVYLEPEQNFPDLSILRRKTG